MAGYSYRLPRKYRYRHRGKSANRDKAIAVAIAAVLAAAVAHKPAAISGAVHEARAGIGAMPVAGGSEDAFIRATLADLGAPATPADIASLASWFPHEYPSWPPWASNNPMSSTLPAAGSTTYNSVGVQNYPTAAEGAQATAQTLANGYYPLIVADLKSGRGLCGDPSLAGEFGTWSGNGYYGVC
jgi:hypothetical protein